MNWPVHFLLVVSGTVGGGGPLAGQVHPYVGRAHGYADHLLPAESYFTNPD